MASSIRTLPMKPKNAFHLYRSIWLPAYQYPLAVTTLSKEACLSIMKHFVHAILPKFGFNCNLPGEIIYGSMKYGGFQFVQLHLEQGYLALKHLIGHICKESIVGSQLMIALSFTQVVSGSRFAYLKEVTVNRTYVPATLPGSIRSFLPVCKGSVVIPKAWLPKKQRINDTILMDVFCSSHSSDATLENSTWSGYILG
eukprot:15365920-Ditylum_brightwellii.AAC.1